MKKVTLRGGRPLHAAAAFLLCGTLLAACSGGKTPSSGASDASGASGGDNGAKPVEISIMTEFSTPEPPAADNPVTKEFEKRTGTKLDITWVSPNSWSDKQNVVLASGDMPDLMKVSDMTNPQMLQLVRQGAFWDLTPYLKDYPNLMSYPKEIWDKTKIDGKNYIIPSVRPLEGASYFAIRKDWLDNLHLKMPETLDDFYNVLKAFTQDDPDKDGKNDTYGYTGKGYNEIINVFNESNGKWKAVDGKLVDTDLEPGTRDGLLWLRRAFADKLMPEDFALMKTTQFEDMAKANQAGVQVDTVEGVWRANAELLKTIPNADFLPFTSLTGPNGQYVPQNSGVTGVYLIPKKVPEAKMIKVLALMDYGASEEGFQLACYGIEGVHFTVVDGFKTATEQAVKDSVSQSSFGKIFERYDKYLWAYHTGMPKNVFERNKTIIDARSKISTPDPSYGLISDTNIRLGADYRKKIDDMKVKVIMGKEPIEAWDAFVKQLKADPDYMKIADEMNKAYQDRLNGK
ncbi:extracellular solute-binding protein [Paenibacillus humicola]|uniref:extracellular solute-binding protein n=1 Tax=Paenibacillus humicola TaxID=3110540 RepID=UPI00237B8411|nr:extracellular solute-binding protein [Paenibacillus humicola]